MLVGGGKQYIVFKQGSNQWKKVGAMKRARSFLTSIFINGNLFTIGGVDSLHEAISHHEQFSVEVGAKERKRLPIALYGHTATIFDENKIIVCGGLDELKVSKTFFRLRFEK